ncbi:hypothetical protein HYC85_015643 [Camellia sinensis]|uniref:Glycosyltransferase 61 catalytic domain-containing protein n=1 Tax=Camellia sinensis TaxID=4442 RepID=A0A7J7GYQ7_CAMSI|nr:hypothetical protein HYC85_015643 [Camellia sinensis]
MKVDSYNEEEGIKKNIGDLVSPTVLDPKLATFYAVGPTNLLEKDEPYSKKWENFTVAQIKEVTLTSGPQSPPCMVHHNAPALAFSAGGCTGSFFHEFNDRFIPLFITVNSVFSNDEDPILVISKSCNWWLRKFASLLRSFSKHQIINLDNDTTTHCFPSRKPMVAENHPFISNLSLKSRPRLVLMSRSGSIGRVILNRVDVKRAAEKEGFHVIEFEPKFETPLDEVYTMISSSHAIVGVHGAALTNFLFLRPGAVVVQVVAIGLEWIAEECFGKSARELGLEYMEYKIGVEESSLGEKYGKDDVLIKDPMSLQKKGWSREIMDIYLEQQNVKLDLVRFRKYLKKAYEKAIISMEKNEDPTNSTPQLMEKIRPFPRNFKHTPINVVRQLTLTTAPPNVSCAVTHTSPALVFNAGVSGWVHHYNDILSTYTRHQIIDFDQETATHCFPSAIVGLISHGASTVDPTLQRRPHPKSLLDFRAFLTAKYSQSHHAPPPPWTSKGKPRLVFLNRNGTRGILNVDNIRRAAEDTGFEVFIFEPSRESSMHEAFRVIDSSHAMIAVHGAGLTNMVFQRPGSVLMQMVPGGVLLVGEPMLRKNGSSVWIRVYSLQH